MKQSLGDLVFPVLSQGLAFKARLASGASINLLAEQATFRDLLQVDNPTCGGPEFCGDAERRGTLGLNAPRAADAALQSEPFLGIRYALVCWLDELFTDESEWGRRWNEQKLEVELYGSNDRAWKFWTQARLAQARPNSDAWEAFYLCCMLGFRGNLRENPEELRKWVAGAKRRLGEVAEIHWPQATELEPPTAVPPLRGRIRLRRMVATACIATLLAIPALAFLAVHHLAH